MKTCLSTSPRAIVDGRWETLVIEQVIRPRLPFFLPQTWPLNKRDNKLTNIPDPLNNKNTNFVSLSIY